MEATITKKVELRGIGFLSTFRIFFAITLVFSLISFIVFNLFGMQFSSMLLEWIGNVRQMVTDLQSQFPYIFENEILKFLIISILGGLVMGLIIGICVGVFSFFAVLLGGIKLTVREKNPEKKTGYL